MYTITKMGTTQLPLSFEDEELDNLLTSFISEYGKSFSYNQLCNSVKYYALHNNSFKKAPHTEYYNIGITDDDHLRITMFLWNLIWEHKLIINFHDTANMVSSRDFKFIKL